jgi:ABC-type dipeptide/oligopeptide/nickel transport system ATPase component
MTEAASATDAPATPILEVRDLSLSFPGVRDERVDVLHGVSFDVRRPETVALVGESGSGKSITALSIMGLTPPAARLDGGRVLLDGRDLTAMNDGERRAFRGSRMAMIFQSPRASLNPLVKVGHQIARVVRLRRGVGRDEARRIAAELMGSVGIDRPHVRYNAYPHQLSGGMAQRVMIAMTLASQPELLIADEPTTALDVTIQSQIFDLLLDLQERLGMSMLLITHDLAVVAETCDRIVVLYRGHVVETGPVKAIFEEPVHPHTQRLVRSILSPDRRVQHGQLRIADGDAAAPADGVLRPVGGIEGHLALTEPR